jgi:hypothetical protein
MTFFVPDDYELSGTEVEVNSDGKKMISVAGTGWYTNLDHGRRHEPLKLMTKQFLARSFSPMTTLSVRLHRIDLGHMTNP